MKSRRFSLGGRLSIYNCLFWLGLSALGKTAPEFVDSTIDVLAPLMFLFSLPILLPFILPSMGHSAPTILSVGIVCLMVGANALIWGHSLAWLTRTLRRRFGVG